MWYYLTSLSPFFVPFSFEFPLFDHSPLVPRAQTSKKKEVGFLMNTRPGGRSELFFVAFICLIAYCPCDPPYLDLGLILPSGEVLDVP